MSAREDAARYLAPGERLVLALKPHPLFIVLRHAGWLAAMLLVAVGGVIVRPMAPYPDVWAVLSGVWFSLVLLRLAWDALEWSVRLYILTDVRAMRVGGVLRRLVVDVPLRRVRTLALYRSVRERLFGLGSIVIAAGDEPGAEFAWVMVRPYQQALDECRAGSDAAPQQVAHGPKPPTAVSRLLEPGKVLVVGLVGGIGAGKSAVAQELERLGCVIVDSDTLAKQALNEPAVRAALAEWWGPGVAGPDGRMDRRAIAAIVFTDPAQRARLEGLIHPRVKAARDEVIAAVRARGGGCVVVDAPLLFEAAIDRDCDAVVFVDAPRETRMARVKAARGWDEEEFDRREKAQIPLEEKRRRSDDSVKNDGGRDVLALRVGELLERLARRSARKNPTTASQGASADGIGAG